MIGHTSAMKTTTWLRRGILACVLVLPRGLAAQETAALGIGDWLTVSSNMDASFRRTQFFEPRYKTVLFDVESRVEFWLPPFRGSFSWGPYIRVAAIASSRDQPWENAWLGAPGVGLQAFPFSSAGARGTGAGRWLGPLRVFAEYDVVRYWGVANSWRPTRRTRIGADYWRAFHVNDHSHAWWGETWHGVSWNSSNEFSSSYDTTVLANAVRLGVRKPNGGAVSSIAPYGIVESSWTRNDEYYWENRLLLGGGLRVAPDLARRNRPGRGMWLTRMVFYAEYLRSAAFYGVTAPPSVPRFDVRVGVGASVGDWYK
ncbi:MAG: hypothetical protein HOP16_09795 [Acidobacteria bacterium]|nr:hypothetical protein [Acidobacteriota bacterium]